MPGVRGELCEPIGTRVTHEEKADWRRYVPARERSAVLRRLAAEEVARRREAAREGAAA